MAKGDQASRAKLVSVGDIANKIINKGQSLSALVEGGQASQTRVPTLSRRPDFSHPQV